MTPPNIKTVRNQHGIYKKHTNKFMSWLQRTAASCGWVNPHHILTVKDIEEQITLVSMSKNPDHQMPIDIYATLCNAIQGRKISLSTLRLMNLLTESSIRGHQRFIEVAVPDELATNTPTMRRPNATRRRSKSEPCHVIGAVRHNGSELTKALYQEI
ncbi:hypothetical protein F4806DRAFT_499744 [Annulohypoxylon nitens]|nr:hypothetical protein F4806DRAFT_499744 [Annulohypoxylon nitens]